MTPNRFDITQIREKIGKGLDLAYQRLLEQKRASGGILILSEQGHIKKIKASEIKH